MRKGVLSTRTKAIFTVSFIALLLVSMSVAVYAQTVSVTIGNPTSPPDLGVNSGVDWIGQIPITLTNGATISSGETYCINPSGALEQYQTYSANIVPVPDDSTWRAISYILSWHNPTTNNEAAADQVAIWITLGSFNPSGFTLDPSITTDATNWANIASGKDVVRQGDQLTWTSPSTGTTTNSPGQTTTFQLQLTSSANIPRPNVQIDFNAILTPPSGPSVTLDSAYVNPAQAFTDSNGMAQVSVTAPTNTPEGSIITVQASTQGIWPQQFLDLTAFNSILQNLIGTSPTLDLTSSVNLVILGYINVLPESAYGALSALIASAAAFIIYYKLRPLGRQPRL